MKRGTKHQALPNPPLPTDTTLAPQLSMFGIPVRYDPDTEHVACARGLWPWKKIIVGEQWFHLTHHEQIAILLHEVKHCLGFHLEIRLLLLPLWRWGMVERLTHRQELAADAFTVRYGFGPALLSFLSRPQRSGGVYYPTFDDRRAHLMLRIKENHHAP